MRAPILPTPNHFLGRTKIDTNYTGGLSANTRMILLTACGAGASGACRSSGAAEGGGSGAHIIRYPIVVIGNDAVSITIGIGGASVTAANTAGNPGTSTTVAIGGYSFVVPGAAGYQSAAYMGLRQRPISGSNPEAYDAVCVDYINTTTGLIIDTKGYFWTGAAGSITPSNRGGNFLGVLGGAGTPGYIGVRCTGAASYFGRGGSIDSSDTPSIINGQGYGAGGAGGQARSGSGGGGVVIIEEYM